MRICFNILAFLCISIFAKAQCPAGASSYVVFYWNMQFLPNGTFVYDSTANFHVNNFQPGSKVYLHNYQHLLIDSLVTDANGNGNKLLPNVFFDSLHQQLMWGTYGYATNGICSTVVTGAGLLPLKITSFSVSGNGNLATIKWQTASEEPGTIYILQQSENAVDFRDLATVASDAANAGRYRFTAFRPIDKSIYFRIKVVSSNQDFFFTKIETLKAETLNEVTIASMADNRLSVAVAAEFLNGQYTIFNSNGVLLFSARITSNNFTLPKIAGQGAYFARFVNLAGKQVTKPFNVSY